MQATIIKNETKYDMGKTMNRYIDEFLSKIAFHAPPSHDMMSWRTVTGSGLLCTHYIVSGLPTRSDECVMSVGCCGSLKKSPYKSNKRVYANTHTPTRCLSPTKSLAKNRLLSFYFTSPQCFERLLVSIFVIVDFIEYILLFYINVNYMTVGSRFINVRGVL